MAKIFTALLVFALLVCAASLSYGQEGKVSSQQERGQQRITSHPSVLTTWVFPDAPTRRFKSAQPQDALVGFSNSNEAKRFNVTRIFGWLSHSSDPNTILQNFTAFGYGYVVSTSQTQTFLYKFYADPMLTPHDYSMTLIVNYHDGPNQYYNIAFNGTVFLEDEEEPVTSLEVLSVFIMLGIVGFFAFLLHKKTRASKPFKASRVQSPTPQTTQVDDSWLPDHVKKHEKNKKTATKKKQQ